MERSATSFEDAVLAEESDDTIESVSEALFLLIDILSFAIESLLDEDSPVRPNPPAFTSLSYRTLFTRRSVADGGEAGRLADSLNIELLIISSFFSALLSSKAAGNCKEIFR